VARAVAMLVFGGFADWEPAFALTGLRRWGGRTVVTAGYDLQPVISMGGLRIVPDQAIADLSPADTELLILPGGDVWESGYPADVLDPVLARMRAARVPVAAICGATIAAARAGLFRGRRHTSNSRAFLLQHAPGSGQDGAYTDVLAVTDDGVISASGLGAVEFAAEIFAHLGVFGADAIRQFTEMYRRGTTTVGQSDAARGQRHR
jgi:putative intracellular protease/amidase